MLTAFAQNELKSFNFTLYVPTASDVLTIISNSFRVNNTVKEIYVTGDFDNWDCTVKLERKGDIFSKNVILGDVNKDISYLFNVDGVWMHSSTQPQRQVGNGFIKNVVRLDMMKKIRVPVKPKPAVGLSSIDSSTAHQDTAAQNKDITQVAAGIKRAREEDIAGPATKRVSKPSSTPFSEPVAPQTAGNRGAQVAAKGTNGATPTAKRSSAGGDDEEQEEEDEEEEDDDDEDDDDEDDDDEEDLDEEEEFLRRIADRPPNTPPATSPHTSARHLGEPPYVLSRSHSLWFPGNEWNLYWPKFTQTSLLGIPKQDDLWLDSYVVHKLDPELEAAGVAGRYDTMHLDGPAMAMFHAIYTSPVGSVSAAQIIAHLKDFP